MSGRDQPVIERRGGGARGGIKRRVGYDKLSLWALFVVAFLAIFWHFLDQIYKCESISLPACASAALLQEIVSRSNPLKECSSWVEPLVVWLCTVDLHLTKFSVSLDIWTIFEETFHLILYISLIFGMILFLSILLPRERLPLKDCPSFLATPMVPYLVPCYRIWSCRAAIYMATNPQSGQRFIHAIKNIFLPPFLFYPFLS